MVDGGRVDARRRQQLVAGREVGGRKAELAAARRAADHGAVDEVVVAEQRPRLVDAPFGDAAAARACC